MTSAELDAFKNVIRRNLEDSGAMDRARSMLRVRPSPSFPVLCWGGGGFFSPRGLGLEG